MNRKWLIILLITGAVLLLAAGILYVVLPADSLTTSPATPTSTFPPPPALDITLPSSLTELAKQYPELAPILTDPELDSVYKEFLVAYQEGGQKAALALARQRGLLTPKGDIRVTLVLDTEDNTPLVAQLQAAGVSVVGAYRDRVNVAVPVALVEAQLCSGQPGDIFAQLTESAHVIAVRFPEHRSPDGSAIEGEGLAVIGADAWHQAGVTGAGLRIGILDLGFVGYHDLLGVELPDDVTMSIFGWYDDEEVHGTACAEIVHEVAPDAELFFAWYDGSDAAMGEAVDWLLAQGVDIISHSAGGLVGPRDGSEWDAQLVDQVAAQGVLWVNSAGNYALSHYRGAFTDIDGDGIHEFASGEESITLYLEDDLEIALNWEDNWQRAVQDYDLFLYDDTGSELAASQNFQRGEVGQRPVEWIEYEINGEAAYVIVTAHDVDQAVTLDLFVEGAEVAYPSADHSICPPGDAVGSLTVGAVNWRNDALASYSSQGPTADGRLKPEISAPTGVSGVTYSPKSFHGTSASAPHVAGTAALVWQAHPEFTHQEVVDYLLAKTLDLGPPGPDTGYGYGRLQLPSPLGATPTSTSTPTATPVVSPSATLRTGTVEPPTATPVGSPTIPPTRLPTATPTSTSTPQPSPTPVAYVTLAPVPPSEATTALPALTSLGLVVRGLGCGGVGLLLLGGAGMLILGRRVWQIQPPPSPVPYPVPPMPPSPVAPQPRPARCWTCGADVRPGACFCSACGHRLVAGQRPHYCQHCGARLREKAHFCPDCGQPTQ